MVHEQEFREDLMFRINTFEIPLPPLRSRVCDIPELAEHLLRRFRPARTMSDQELFTPDAIEVLQASPWPGNVRELANVIEHATILADELPITVEHLPDRLHHPRSWRLARSANPPMTLRELEMQAIDQAIERHAGSKPAAADELGISLKSLYNKLNQAQNLEKSA
jgi:DNA-binding NtrC family response regulator